MKIEKTPFIITTVNCEKDILNFSTVELSSSPPSHHPKPSCFSSFISSLFVVATLLLHINTHTKKRDKGSIIDYYKKSTTVRTK